MATATFVVLLQAVFNKIFPEAAFSFIIHVFRATIHRCPQRMD